MDEQRQDDQREPISNSSFLMQDVALKTYLERWTIEKGGGIGSGRFVLAVQHDDCYLALTIGFSISQLFAHS